MGTETRIAEANTPAHERVFEFYPAAWYRRSPFFESTLKHGANAWDIYNHMLTPSIYEGNDEADDYDALVNGVTMWDVAPERQVEITGPDAFEFTNLLTCRDLTKCEVWQCKYAPITSAEGGVLNDPILLRLGEDRFWLSLADSDTLLWVKGVAVNSGLDVNICEPDVSPMQVQGPRARDVIRDLFGPEIEGLKYYWCAEADLDGIPVVISRTGWSGVAGYEIYLRDASQGNDLWERVLAAGKPHDIRPITPNESRRVEAGIFNLGSDFQWDDNPFEITGMERLVESQSADYIGKGALEAIRKQGVTRKLVGVTIEGPLLSGWVPEFWPVFGQQGDRVGHLTAGVWSPNLEKNIGYAWVPIGLAEKGTPLSIGIPEDERSAEVTSMPFIDPKKQIPAA